MKKYYALSLAVAALVLLSLAGAAFAEGDTRSNELVEKFVKLVEKGTVDVSYTVESKSKNGGTEVVSISKSWFVTSKKFVSETEVAGNVLKVVIDPAGSWLYDRNQNIIMPLEGKNAEKFDLQGALVKLGQACEISEASKGDETVFTLFQKEKKITAVFTANKDGYLVKMVMKNGRGEVVSESSYRDYKFGKIDESVFGRPAGAKLLNPDGTPKDEQAK